MSDKDRVVKIMRQSSWEYPCIVHSGYFELKYNKNNVKKWHGVVMVVVGGVKDNSWWW